ncbi:MAG: sulfatase-like hydrolase/transferase [Planctomycetes bacterium]|nr:sulfatase-like hydrolase/transferase [Planctomycetota bacterium]
MGRVLLIVLLLASFAWARQPNIVFILADDLGYECLSCDGGGPYKTPTLDNLAATGVRFTNVHAQPLCTPSRVQLMTGRYNSRNYISFGELKPTEKTFGNMLKDAGYVTGVVGKWQLGGGYEGPGHFGFDEYCLWQLNRRPNRYPNPGFEIDGKQVDFKNGEYGPDIVNKYALDFIERHKDKPFFLYYPMMLVHAPFDPTPESKDWDPTFRRGDKAEKSNDAIGGKHNERHLVEMVSHTDKMVANVLAKLDELGLRDNTLVIFTGDNGTTAGVHSTLDGKPYIGGKGSSHDNGTRVPLIANWPGHVTSGFVCEDLVDFSDMLPTFAEVSGAATPAGVEMDGQSFWPQLSGKQGRPRQWVYSWYHPKLGNFKNAEWARTVEFKLYSDGRMFNVIKDPHEGKPLSDTDLNKKQIELRDELRGVIDRFARKD